MGDEVIIHESQEIAISRAPEEVLEEASKAANALQDVISKKKDVVKMNGKVYLTFEDWQTLAKFYGMTVGVDSTEYIEYGQVVGFEATAVVRNSEGINVSRAEAMCLNDEKNWKEKPLFQLKSMAQTRACSKALRNVLSFVAVLAGYAGTPAEEMTGDEFKKPQKGGNEPSQAQIKMICGILNEMGHQTEQEKYATATQLLETPGPIQSWKDITKAEASDLIKKLQVEAAN